MNLHLARIPATISALLLSFALAGCGGEEATDTESNELSEKSTQTPPSQAQETAPVVEFGDPDLGRPNLDPTDNTPPRAARPQ